MGGKAVRMKNEAGKKMQPLKEKEAPQFYARWQKHSHKRIQEVGEVEDASLKTQTPKRRKIVDTTADDDDGGGPAPSVERAGKKPIVPFTGKIEAKYLTHKQKRLMKKREKSGVTRGDNARDEVKSSVKMIKDRKAKEERKIKANPHARKSWADGKKKAHRDKVQRGIDKKEASHARSFNIAAAAGNKRKMVMEASTGKKKLKR